MGRHEQIGVNGHEVWTYVVELVDGLRIKFDVTDWERLGLYQGMRISLRRQDGREEWAFVAEVVELPPLVWVVLANRVKAAG
jgi:hypothetical protein